MQLTALLTSTIFFSALTAAQYFGAERVALARRAAEVAYYDTLYARDVDSYDEFGLDSRDLHDHDDDFHLGRRTTTYRKCQSCKATTFDMKTVRCPSCGKGPLTTIRNMS